MAHDVYLSLSDRPDRTVAPNARRPRIPRVVWLLGLVSLFTDISSEAVTAILPLYLTAVLGLSTIAYGVVDGLYQGVSALVRIGGGWAADRSDHPKWVAFVGYGLSCVARLALLFADRARRDHRGRHRRPDRQGSAHGATRRDDRRERPPPRTWAAPSACTAPSTPSAPCSAR